MNYGKGWLAYNRINDFQDGELLTDIHVCLPKDEKIGEIRENTIEELSTALKGMLDIELSQANFISEKKDIDKVEGGIVLGLSDQEGIHGISVADKLDEEGYHIQVDKKIYIIGKTEKRSI